MYSYIKTTTRLWISSIFLSGLPSSGLTLLTKYPFGSCYENVSVSQPLVPGTVVHRYQDPNPGVWQYGVWDGLTVEIVVTYRGNIVDKFTTRGQRYEWKTFWPQLEESVIKWRAPGSVNRPSAFDSIKTGSIKSWPAVKYLQNTKNQNITSRASWSSDS